MKKLIISLFLTLGFINRQAAEVQALAMDRPFEMSTLALIEPLEHVSTVNVTKYAPLELMTIVEPPKPARVVAGSFPGNNYEWGNCTWYVKNMRPDLPNDLGNANQWIDGAQRYGLSVGQKPYAGSVGVSFGGYWGHVVYVESVAGDTITISEMNSVGLGVVSTRTANASDFTYIY